MSISAFVQTESTGDVCIRIKGALEYEDLAPLFCSLVKLSKENPASFITIDVDKLEFVGSSGIGNLVEGLNVLLKKKCRLRLANVRVEFKRIFALYKLSPISMIEEESEEEEESVTPKNSKHRILHGRA
jgi:anti-sigma B factor antagonist